MFFVSYKNQSFYGFLNYILSKTDICNYYTIDSKVIKDKTNSF